jgi:hypothetical protein
VWAKDLFVCLFVRLIFLRWISLSLLGACVLMRRINGVEQQKQVHHEKENRNGNFFSLISLWRKGNV